MIEENYMSCIAFFRLLFGNVRMNIYVSAGICLWKL